MIYGLGTDIVEVERIEKALQRWGDRFARRILCDAELRRFGGHRQKANYLAKRFAAKEAFGKALGTGIHAPANWHGVWVKNLPSGKPVLEFSGDLRALLQQRRISGHHLSLADERGMALGTGIHAPANWHGVWVKNLPSGKPVLEFSGDLRALLQQRRISGHHLSLADERGMAVATVILECEK